MYYRARSTRAESYRPHQTTTFEHPARYTHITIPRPTVNGRFSFNVYVHSRNIQAFLYNIIIRAPCIFEYSDTAKGAQRCVLKIVPAIRRHPRLSSLSTLQYAVVYTRSAYVYRTCFIRL